MLPGLITIQTTRKKIGTRLLQFESVTSTNTWLFEHPEYLDMDGLVIQAAYQTAGKGRNQRAWLSGTQKHLFCSLVTHLPYTNENIASITLLAGLAINKALRKLTDIPFEIKWPNDILIGKHKICGILCEMKLQNVKGQPIIIVGFGININGDLDQYPKELQNKVTTLQMLTNKQYNIEEIRESVLNEFEMIYQTSIDSGLKTIIEEWEQLSCSIGKEIYFEQVGIKLAGEIIGLNQNGHLQVRTSNSDEILSVLSGEIEYIDPFYDKNN